MQDEIYTIYYGKNEFTFKSDGTQDMFYFLLNIGVKARPYIRNISFGFEGHHRTAAFDLLGQCTGLKKLQITLTGETMAGSPLATKDQLSRAFGMRPLKKIRGLKNLQLRVDVGGSVAFTAAMVKRFEDDLKQSMTKKERKTKSEVEKENTQKYYMALFKRYMEDLAYHHLSRNREIVYFAWH